jgi:hypothetical protein
MSVDPVRTYAAEELAKKHDWCPSCGRGWNLYAAPSAALDPVTVEAIAAAVPQTNQSSGMDQVDRRLEKYQHVEPVTSNSRAEK